MLAHPWPLWSENEIDALKLGYLNDVIDCKDGFGAFAALAFAALGVLKLPKAAVLPSPSKKFRCPGTLAASDTR